LLAPQSDLVGKWGHTKAAKKNKTKKNTGIGTTVTKTLFDKIKK